MDRTRLSREDETLDWIINWSQNELDLEDEIDWEQFNVDGTTVPASRAVVGAVEERLPAETTSLRPVSTYGKSKAEMERTLQRELSETKSFWKRLPIPVVRRRCTVPRAEFVAL